MRPSVPLFVAATLALAGCSNGGGTGTPDGGAGGLPHAEHGGVPPIEAPAWQLGQWWTLSSEQAAADFTHVVSGESATDWTVDTDSPDVAFFDARSDISFLGPVRKSDLAGSQGPDRVQFFQFPLLLNKTWTTRWDGLPVTVTVVEAAEDRATLEARRANGTLHADYVYDAKLGYFREYAFYAPDGETVSFAARVSSNGNAFAGDLVRWSLATLFEAHDAGPFAQGFDVDAGITDVWADLHFSCGQGAFSLTFGPTAGAPQQRGFTASGPCPAQLDETSTITPPAQDNEAWGVVAGSATADRAASLDLVILARTQAVFKVGAAP